LGVLLLVTGENSDAALAGLTVSLLTTGGADKASLDSLVWTVTLAGMGVLVWANTVVAKNKEATAQATRLPGVVLVSANSLVFVWPQIKSATSKSVLKLFLKP
jgi:Na+-translocating ferredoxin:NAD+ oxidoreductase RnfE subunit